MRREGNKIRSRNGVVGICLELQKEQHAAGQSESERGLSADEELRAMKVIIKTNLW